MPRDHDRPVKRHRIGHHPRQHDASVDRGHAQATAGDVVELQRKSADVIGDLDVEDSDDPPAFAIHGYARHPDLLAEDRQRTVGERRDVRHVGIADHDIRERRIDTDVLCLASSDGYGSGSPAIEHCKAFLCLPQPWQAKQTGRGHQRDCSKSCEGPATSVDPPCAAPSLPGPPARLPRSPDHGLLFVIVVHDLAPRPPPRSPIAEVCVVCCCALPDYLAPIVASRPPSFGTEYSNFWPPRTTDMVVK